MDKLEKVTFPQVYCLASRIVQTEFQSLLLPFWLDTLVQYTNCISIKLFKYIYFLRKKKKKRCSADRTMGRAEVWKQWRHHAPSSQPPGCSRNTGVTFLAQGLAFGYVLLWCMCLQRPAGWLPPCSTSLLRGPLPAPLLNAGHSSAPLWLSFQL